MAGGIGSGQGRSSTQVRIPKSNVTDRLGGQAGLAPGVTSASGSTRQGSSALVQPWEERSSVRSAQSTRIRPGFLPTPGRAGLGPAALQQPEELAQRKKAQATYAQSIEGSPTPQSPPKMIDQMRNFSRRTASPVQSGGPSGIGLGRADIEKASQGIMLSRQALAQQRETTMAHLQKLMGSGQPVNPTSFGHLLPQARSFQSSGGISSQGTGSINHESSSFGSSGYRQLSGQGTGESLNAAPDPWGWT